MICMVQRVLSCSVTVGGETVSSQERGFLLLLGVAGGDCESDADALASKIARLRVFEDENGKMNKNVTDAGGRITVVPNFTLLASYKKGNRPDFLASAAPDEANRLFEYFKSKLAAELCALGGNADVGSGVFGADMKVSLINDGPVTINMDSKVLTGK